MRDKGEIEVLDQLGRERVDEVECSEIIKIQTVGKSKKGPRRTRRRAID